MVVVHVAGRPDDAASKDGSIEESEGKNGPTAR